MIDVQYFQDEYVCDKPKPVYDACNQEKMVAILQTTNSFFFYENCCILIQISLTLTESKIKNNPALVRIMARCQGDKPLSEPIMVQFTDAYMRHPVSKS